MNHTYNKPSLKQNRRKLRNELTPAEKRLWHHLRNRQLNNLRFLRQYSVGEYILDFYCPKKRLAIEIDGGQHNEPRHKRYDQRRSHYLNTKDISVIRFWNNEVFTNIEGIFEKIIETAEGN